MFLMNPDGSGKVCVSPEGMHVDGASWSPDGSRMVVSVYLDGASLLGVLDLDMGLVSPTRESDLDSSPEWSPDGTGTVFVSRTDEAGAKIPPEIYLIEPNGLGRTRLPHCAGRKSSPSWSPDGTRIIYASDGDGTDGIYVMNADGSGVILLTQGHGMISQPAWGP